MSESGQVGLVCLTETQEDCTVQATQGYSAAFQSVGPATLRALRLGMETIFGVIYKSSGMGLACFCSLF